MRAQGKPRPAQTEALWLRAPGAPSGRPASPRDGARTMRGACGPPPSPRGARSVNSARFPPSAAAPLGWSARSGERVHWRAVLRVTVSSEPPQGRNAARIRVRCRVRGGSSYSPGHSAPPPVPPGRSPRERAPVPRPSGAASSACAAERHGPRPVPWTVSARGALRRPGRRRPPPRAVRPAAPPARRASRRAGPIRCSSTRWRSGSR